MDTHHLINRYRQPSTRSPPSRTVVAGSSLGLKPQAEGRLAGPACLEGTCGPASNRYSNLTDSSSLAIARPGKETAMQRARPAHPWIPLLVLFLFVAGCSTAKQEEVEKLGGRVQGSDGGVSLTLTNWHGSAADYELVKKYAKVVKLKMANKDVTDKVLEAVRGLSDLQELDLDDTQVTDAGLDALKGLKKLEILHLENTKVTDRALETLDGLEKLTRLELAGTGVTRQAAEKWKAAKPGRRYSL
jgi:hypothetical protein